MIPWKCVLIADLNFITDLELALFLPVKDVPIVKYTGPKKPDMSTQEALQMVQSLNTCNGCLNCKGKGSFRIRFLNLCAH